MKNSPSEGKSPSVVEEAATTFGVETWRGEMEVQFFLVLF